MSTKKYGKVAVGGTFDKFHEGHRLLIEKAFQIGENVLIGVTSDEFGGLKGEIEPCDVRMSNLNLLLKDNQTTTWPVWRNTTAQQWMTQL